ncbi:unnamed protein product [Ophioblennius macclurei]
MDDFAQDGDLEADYTIDFSQTKNRLSSFRGSTVTQQVSAEKLAQAGFYFTGQADRVRCFSCRKTVENWFTGDTPVERHKEVSPSCVFLSCIHRVGSDSPLSNGSVPNDEQVHMQYLLRTGAVVDETTYPISPHMRNEEARLQTFSSWPSNNPMRPRELAQAGLYYLGHDDSVKCFCCDGGLSGWTAEDNAWGEHSKYYSNCFFILGHDVGNVPLQGGSEEQEEESRGSSSQRANTEVRMGSLEERLSSFEGVQHPIEHERLARAGFYSIGKGDKVSCFRCGGNLKGWQPEEDPWEEHAKHYPGCSFVLAEKGQEFVSKIQLQGPSHSQSNASHQNGFSAAKNDVLQSPMAQEVIQMGFDPSVVENVILDKMSRTGSGYSSLERLVQDTLSNASGKDEDPLEKLRKLQREKQCKICMDRDICIVFIPCGHLVSCKECSGPLVKCPICCGEISQKIMAYIA